jgi:hypothetical protein
MEEILIGAVGNSQTEPSAGYHGLVYHEALGNAALLLK